MHPKIHIVCLDARMTTTMTNENERNTKSIVPVPCSQTHASPNITELQYLLNNHPIPYINDNGNGNGNDNGQRVVYEYGTAGFRCDHSILPPVLIRMGILASLRSASLNGVSES